MSRKNFLSALMQQHSGLLKEIYIKVLKSTDWVSQNDAANKHKFLSGKVKEKIKEHKRNNDAWYIPIDDTYNTHKIKQEVYYKWQYSGRPLQMLLNKASNVFNAAEVMLEDHLSPDKDKGIIDEVCNKMIELLQSWRAVFKIVGEKVQLKRT